MKSPFPGMDPFIEARGTLWEDFHHDLIADVKRALAERLPPSFAVRSQYHAFAEEYREAFLEVYEVEPEWRLVTAIEVLSPSNKRPNTPGWNQYQRKRQALLMGEANLVEIDLLRGGTRPPMLDPWPASPYTLLVARAESAPSCQVWPAHYRQPLPPIPVPLTPPHADVRLELQPLVDAVYARSRYADSIDYARPLSPPLSEEESAWLAERLRQRA